ncbi:MAG: hypothetical protein HT580_04935 [Dechloromonas sp.]|nr:MAG: hypothetical protein HT580_04935 [Dechloromonas sp.]
MGRLESLLAGGMHIGFIERKSGIAENKIHALLDAGHRSSLGEINGRG